METTGRKHQHSDELDRDTAVTVGRVRDALRGLRYGEIRIVVHDGAVVQVERTERLRLMKATGA
jgi:hypothetical protein